MKIIYVFGIIIAVTVCAVIVTAMSGCAVLSKDHHKLYGWGNAKIDQDGNVTEITSSPPISLPKVEF